jgi:hypothetical protein
MEDIHDRGLRIANYGDDQSIALQWFENCMISIRMINETISENSGSHMGRYILFLLSTVMEIIVVNSSDLIDSAYDICIQYFNIKEINTGYFDILPTHLGVLQLTAWMNKN